MGRQEWIEIPDGTMTWFGYGHGESQRVSGVSRNAQAFPDSATAWTEVNARGDVVRIWDEAGHMLEHEYDATGNLVETIAPGNIKTKFKYDLRGHKTEMTDPSMGKWTYAYNAFGELVEQVDAKQQKTEMEYDALGRLIRRERPDGVSTWTYWETTNPASQQRPAHGWIGALRQESHTQYAQHDEAAYTNRRSFHYDGLGRPTLTLHNLEEKWFYEYTRYDSIGRVHRVDRFWRPKGLDGAGQAGQDPAYAWHSFGQVYSYDSADGGDGFGFVTKVSDSHNHVWWSDPEYDERGRVKSFLNGNKLNGSAGERTSYTYNTQTHALERVRSQAGGNTFHDMQFEFDELGNLEWRKDLVHNLSESFEYDALNQLKRVKLGDHVTEAITYDSLGLGRIMARSNVGTYTYADAMKPYQLTGIAGGVAVSSTQYDANGNITSQSRMGESVSIQWSSFNKPVRLGVGTNGSTFRYDANGSRVAHVIREEGLDTRKTLYIGGFEQSRIKDGSNWVTDYTRISISTPSGVVGTYDHKAGASGPNQNTRSFYHYDHLGTIVAVTGSWMDGVAGNPYLASADAIQRFSYDAWGMERKATTWSGSAVAPSPDPDLDFADVHRGFTGHEMLRHLGLVHMNGRIYDPLLGRFLSADLYVQSPGDLQNYNRYSYVLNNPLSYSDPSGYFFKKLFKSIGKFVKKYWKQIVTIALVVVASYFTFGWAAAAYGKVAGGAIAGTAGGFVGGVVGTALHGGNLSQALSAGLVGAFWGGLAGAAAGQIGVWAGDWTKAVEFKRALAHGVSGGAIGQVRDGNFAAGFLAGGASTFVSHAKFSSGWNEAQHMVAAAVIGGTASRIGGGRFENGAVTGAFQYLFNALGTRWEARNLVLKLKDRMESLGFGVEDALNDATLKVIVADEGSVTITYKDGTSKTVGNIGGLYDSNGHSLTILTKGRSLDAIAGDLIHKIEHVRQTKTGMTDEYNREFHAYEAQGRFMHAAKMRMKYGFHNSDGSMDSNKFKAFYQNRYGHRTSSWGSSASSSKANYVNRFDFKGNDFY